jgi:hypothetical protein
VSNHRLATASAADRGNASVFATLVVQADAITARLHASRAMDLARSRRLRVVWPERDLGLR